jgi:transposase
MRRHRERRRQGLRTFIIDLRETEIDFLVQKGLLDPQRRLHRFSVVKALYAFLEGETRRANSA